MKALVVGVYKWGSKGGIACLGLHTRVFQAEIYAIKACIMKNTHQCRDLNCYYKVWILCKNCDLRISKYLCHFDVLTKTVKYSLKMV